MDSMLPLVAVVCGAAVALALGTILVVFLVRRKRESEPRPSDHVAVASSLPPQAPSIGTGTPVSADVPAVATVRISDGPVVREPGWTLAMVDGPQPGARFPLREVSQVGRNPGLDVVVSDPQVSRHHATIRRSGEGVVVTDAGSSNGTFVNGARIHEPTALAHGDTIRVGDSWFSVEREGARRAAGTTSYCARCGNALTSGHSPCPTCSASAPAPRSVSPSAPPLPRQSPLRPAAMPSVAASQPPPPTEPIVGVITGLARRKGLMGVQEFNLVLTGRRLIFDRITNEMLKGAVIEARQSAKDEGKGFFGQIGAQMGFASQFTDRYMSMRLDDILRLHPDNFSVPVDQIRKVTLRVGNQGQGSADQMVIHGPEKLRFDLKRTSAGNARATLRQVLGRRVR